jgi:hypothetical protein
MEKQIEKIVEEMANEVCPNNVSELCASGRCSKLWECPFNIHTIEILAKQGYRKQEQGEWKMVKYPLTKCSNCDVVRNCEKDTGWKYCPHCGAKMKGN